MRVDPVCPRLVRRGKLCLSRSVCNSCIYSLFHQHSRNNLLLTRIAVSRAQSPIAVAGYPVGGDSLSITKGIVSRLTLVRVFRSGHYHHSGICGSLWDVRACPALVTLLCV